MKSLLSVLFCFLSLVGFTQKNEKIQILNAEEFRYSEKTEKNAQRLIGNVKLKHQDALMFCDSAYLYKSSSQVEAFGNVRIKQGDSLTLYGDYLQYNSDVKLATVKQNVRLVRPDLVLKTDEIKLDRTSNIAYYTSGGIIESYTDNNTLTSKNGYFHLNTNIMYFKKDVVLTSPDYTIKSDTMRYNTNNEDVNFFGPTAIESDQNYIYCENGYYNTRTEQSMFYQNAYLLSENKALRGDTISYDRAKGYGEARSNISITDTVENIIVKGELAKFYEANDSIEVTKKALLIQPFEEDTLYMHAQLFKVFPNPEGKRILQAYYHVNIYKSDLQGSCDSVAYAFTDSTLKMYYQPILWSDQNQITGTIININTRDGKIDQLFIPEDAFITSEVDSNRSRYNQIKGKQLTGTFLKNALRKVLIEGNGQTIYYGQDEEEKFIGVNRAESSDLLIGIQNNDIETITFLNDPDATLYPLSELSIEELTLQGFKWQGSFRPNSPLDLFNWKRGQLR